MSELDEIKRRKMEEMLKRLEEKPPAIRLKVFGAPASSSSCGPSCEPSCGPSTCGPGISFEDITKELGLRLQEVFGNTVKTEYVDLIKHAHEYPQVLYLIQTRQLPLPLVMINGKLKFAGGIPLPKIIQEIERLKDV